MKQLLSNSTSSTAHISRPFSRSTLELPTPKITLFMRLTEEVGSSLDTPFEMSSNVVEHTNGSDSKSGIRSLPKLWRSCETLNLNLALYLTPQKQRFAYGFIKVNQPRPRIHAPNFFIEIIKQTKIDLSLH